MKIAARAIDVHRCSMIFNDFRQFQKPRVEDENRNSEIAIRSRKLKFEARNLKIGDLNLKIDHDS